MAITTVNYPSPLATNPSSLTPNPKPLTLSGPTSTPTPNQIYFGFALFPSPALFRPW